MWGGNMESEKLLFKLLKMTRDENRLLKEKIAILESELSTVKEDSTRDNLTGLYNRKIVDEAYDNSDTVIMCDIDNFKQLNDNFGHNFGDQMLVEISDMIKSCVRSTDYVLRWGGEEFLIFVRTSSIEVAVSLAERIRKNTENINMGDDSKPIVTMSFGVSKLDKTDSLISDIKKVDEALYDSKKSGKNKITIASLEDKKLILGN